MPKKNISATIDEALLKRLDHLAEKTERKKSWIISKALESLLDRFEASVPGRVAEKAEVYGDPVQRLIETERLYEEARELGSQKIQPIVKSFDTFEEYERWREEQKDPWYR